MKKLIALVLTVCMLAAFMAGCGDANSTPTTAPSADVAQDPTTAAEPAKLTLILRAGSYTDVIKALAPQFEAENNCTIEILDLDLSDMYQKIALDSQNAVGAYDVIMVDGSWFTEFQQAGILANLSSMGYTLDDDFIEGTVAGGLGDDGDVYCVPFFGNVQLFYYNKTILSKYGYNEAPDNWQDVLALAQKASADGLIGFAARAQAGENIVTDIDPLVLSAGGQVMDADNNITINTPEYKQALELYMELIKAGQIMTKDDIVAAVNNGTAAMSLIWPGWYTPSADEDATFGLMPQKLTADGEAHSSAWYGLWYMGVTNNSQNKDLALKFIDYVTSSESEIATVQYGLTPIRNSAYADASVLEQSPLLAIVYEALKDAVYRPGVPQWTDITNTLGVELDNAVQGVKTVDAALADAQSACEAIMAK